MLTNNILINVSLVLAFVFSASVFQPAYSNNDEPISYTGHGAMFDKNGKEIQVTPEFIRKAQKFYLDTLQKQADENQRALFAQKQKRLFSGQQWDKRSELYANSALIEWLIKEVKPANAGELSGKLKLLQRTLTLPSFQIDPSVNIKDVTPFELPKALKDLLIEEGLAGSGGGDIALLSTTLGGPAYINECKAAGVPTPPDWGTSQWVSRGILTNEFISSGLEAEVFTYKSNAPEGMCIALPRSTGNTIYLLGIVCLGKASSNTCF